MKFSSNHFPWAKVSKMTNSVSIRFHRALVPQRNSLSLQHSVCSGICIHIKLQLPMGACGGLKNTKSVLSFIWIWMGCFCNWHPPELVMWQRLNKCCYTLRRRCVCGVKISLSLYAYWNWKVSKWTWRCKLLLTTVAAPTKGGLAASERAKILASFYLETQHSSRRAKTSQSSTYSVFMCGSVTTVDESLSSIGALPLNCGASEEPKRSILNRICGIP